MLMGLSLGAAGTGIDPVTGGTITCNPGDTFDPATSMCYDSSSDVPEYYGTLTLPAGGSTTTATVSTTPIATCPTGSTCTYINGVPDMFVYIGLGVAAWFLFKGAH
jgi:hypothetical protein